MGWTDSLYAIVLGLARFARHPVRVNAGLRCWQTVASEIRYDTEISRTLLPAPQESQ